MDSKFYQTSIVSEMLLSLEGLESTLEGFKQQK